MPAQVLIDRALWTYHLRMLRTGPVRKYGLLMVCAASSALSATIALFVNARGDVRLVCEAITPILAAVLVVLSLEPELHSNNLSLLGCRGGLLRRVILPRALAGMAAALVLQWLSLVLLAAFVPLDEVMPALLAAFPSVWALSLLALTAAMIFRSTLAGISIAAVVWGVSLAGGYGMHPLLGLQGYYAASEFHPLSTLWVAGKLALLAAGVLMLLSQRRWLMGRKAILRPGPVAIGLAMILVAGAYAVSGAFTVVTFAYLSRGSDVTGGSEWLRAQMQPFQKAGIPALFGPAFQAYLALPPDGLTVTEARERRKGQLQAAIAHWPHSIWAENIVLEAAAQDEVLNPQEAGRIYLRFAESHPHSPLAKLALMRLIQAEMVHLPAVYRQGVTVPGTPEGFTAARKLIDTYPEGAPAKRATEYLETHY